MARAAGSRPPPSACSPRRPPTWMPRWRRSRTRSAPPSSTASSPTRSTPSCPTSPTENAAKAAEARHFTFFHHQVGSTGTTYLHGELDLADAHDLETAITAEAEALRLEGSTESLDVRRAIAAGRIARQPPRPRPRRSPSHRRRRGVSCAARAKRSEDPAGGPLRAPLRSRHHRQHHRQGRLELAQVNNHHRTVTAEQVRTWCANPDTQVIVKPVIDLDQHIGVAAYEVPERLAEQTQVRDGTCVFPWCTRPAIACDSEHITAHADGGTTCSCNIAPVCRRHHRLKTHTPVDLHRHRPRHLPVDQPPRLPVPPRPPRHHRRHPPCNGHRQIGHPPEE